MSKYDATMMATAQLWAEHSTCSRLAVGAIVARDERILVQGYNGAPKGMPHCDHRCDCSLPDMLRKSPNLEGMLSHDDDCATNSAGCVAVHAEQNAIAWAARVGAPLYNSTLYTTHQPCIICARLVITTGINRVVYAEPYRLVEGLQLLRSARINVTKLSRQIDYDD